MPTFKTPDATMEHKRAHIPFLKKLRPSLYFPTIGRMEPGSARRKIMIEYFVRQREQGFEPAIRVNARYCLRSSDSDLMLLVKRGILVRTRTGGRPGSKRTTELHLAPGYL